MGPNLVFRGEVRFADPPLHHRQIFHQNVLVFLVSDRTDRQTDGQTDRRNKYVLGLPCFKTPNGKWVRVKRRWGIYILNFFKRDLFVFLSEKFRGLNDVQ